jgi:hypothetical protein
MTQVFCIQHQEFVLLEVGHHCTGHTFVLYNDPEIGLSSLDFHCMTPEDYTFIAPPEFDMDLWLERVWEVEPTDSELREIEAEQIERDLSWLTN